MKNSTKNWLDEANWNFENARILLKKKRYNSSVFFSQQAAEMAVKALLSYCNLNGWGHSIAKLLEKYNELKDRKVDIVLKAAQDLDEHYIPSRYPDALNGKAPHNVYNKEDAKEAVKQSERILDYIKKEMEFFDDQAKKSNNS